MSSEHNVTVVRIGEIEKHGGADTLAITEVDGRPVIIRIGEYATGDLAIYVPIDSLAPVTDPRFSFLKPNNEGMSRIKAMRLRGVFSMGLLIKPDADMAEGDEVRERLGIEIYEPDVSRGGGHGPGGKFLSSGAERDPGILPVYDVESARKYRSVLNEGEEVVLTEKIHGANARFVYWDNRLWCASRNQFKAMDPNDLWWSLALKYRLEEKLSARPGIALYGEAYGQVQDLKYGANDHRLALFDALDIRTREWLNADAFYALADSLDIPTAPILYRGPWSAERWPEFKALAEGVTVIGNGANVREGWVLRPTTERSVRSLGRVQMKFVGEGYSLRKAA